MLLPKLPIGAPTLAPTLSVARSPAIHCSAVGNALLSSPETWAVGTLALLCTTFAGIEKTFEVAKERTPLYAQPIINAVLGEMASMGFMGLLVNADYLGLQQGAIAGLSEEYLGESQLSFDLFQGIDNTLFGTSVGYFICCSVLVARVVGRLEGLYENLDAGGDIVTLEEFQTARPKAGDQALSATLRAREARRVSLKDLERVGTKGGVTLNDLKEISAERLEDLVEIDPLTVFLIVATFGLPGLVLQITTDQVTTYVPGDVAEVVPFVVVASAGVVAASFALFSETIIALGDGLVAERFVLKAVKVLAFIAAYAVAGNAQAFVQAVGVVLDGGANAAVLTELGGLGASLVAALLVIVRVDSVLFEYVGAASAARLERIGDIEEDRGVGAK